MVDNVLLNSGTGGDTIATEDVAGVEYQKVKLVDGTATSTTAIPLSGDLTNGLDVDVTRVGGTVTVDGSASTQPVSGTVAVTGVALASNQLADGHNVTIDNGAAGAAVNIQDGGNVITVDGTVTANAGTGTQAVSLASVPSHAVTNAGTFAVQLSAAGGLTALQLLDNPIVAHDAAVSGSTGVSMIGARATNSVEAITQVANADATRLQADLNGVLLSRNGTTLEEIISERVSIATTTSTAFTNFASGGAGIHNYITAISIYNSNATTGGYVDFRNGTAGAIVWTMAAPAGGGSVLSFDPPLKFADATAVAYDVSAAISTVYISVAGYQAKG